MDLLAAVPEDFLLKVGGAKGGMELVDAAEMERLVNLLPHPPGLAPGGSAANCTVNAARLGLRATFLGKLGHDDAAEAYAARFAALGLDTSRFKRGALPNARCLALVTPDAERTMRTCLGAAMTLAPDEISVADFAAARHAHVEGYLVFNRALADAVLSAARAAGCSVSLDCASFEVIRATRDWLFTQLGQGGIDLLFANEDEIRALFDDATTPYPELARRLAALGVTAVVKVGKDGAWIARGDELHRIAPVPAPQVVDTNGAGDAWAGGFLYGYLRGWSLPAAGALGSRLGSECVRHPGPAIPDHAWPDLHVAAAAVSA